MLLLGALTALAQDNKGIYSWSEQIKKYANGICSIPHKLNFCTRLVQNYKRWIMQQLQCQTYCNLFLGDIKQLLFQNAIR